MQKHHEQNSWTTKSTRCYMYGKIGVRSADRGPRLVIITLQSEEKGKNGSSDDEFRSRPCSSPSKACM